MSTNGWVKQMETLRSMIDASSEDFAANDAVVQTYANRVLTNLANWSQLATSGVGRLPEHVVADTATGLMWSRSSLTLAGTSIFCWAYCGENLSISTLLTPATVIDGLSGWAIPSQAQFAVLVDQPFSFKFLTANGFQWQKSGISVEISGLRVEAPAYWSAGHTSVGYRYGDGISALYDQNRWPIFLPGPGAVAVRPIH